MRYFYFLVLMALALCAQGPAANFPPGTFQNRAPLDATAAASCTPGTPATNFIARTSGLSVAETDAYCALINGLVTDSIITGNLSGATGCGTVLDGLYMFATKDTTTANLNLCGTSFGITVNGSPTFTADRGYTGDATAAFLDTGFGPNIGGGSPRGNFAQDSATMGVCVLNARTATSLWAEIGSEETAGTSSQSFIILTGNTGGFARINSNSDPGFAGASTQGTLVSSRTASNLTTTYRNGVSLGTDATASQVLSSANIYILALNQNVVGAIIPTGDQIGAGFFGAGLDATKTAAVSSRISAFITAVGGSGC